MKRRSFFTKSTAAMVGMGLTTSPFNKANLNKEKDALKVCTTMDQNQVCFYSEVIHESIKVIYIADTHLSKDDDRGKPFQEYSKRMAAAYQQTTHFQTGEETHPEKGFEEALAYAKEVEADLIILNGDIFSFPSEAAIEWVISKLEKTALPYIYNAGNHDWHYEGMKGDLASLRDTWIEKRLLPLYKGKDPLKSYYEIKGVRFLAVDNSTYEISSSQLDFLRDQIASGLPLILLVHIPLYAPGKGIYYGCGNPSWGAATDDNYELERRPQWPERGHSQTTFDFHKEVFDAPNVLGVFAGHIHRNSIELIKGKPQIVIDDNASGAYLEVDFLPLTQADQKLIY